MSSVDKLFKLADRFARKMSLGQQTSAQPGEVQNALQAAGLWDKAAEVSPLLGSAGVDDGPIVITMTIDKGLNFKYNVTATPPPAALKLAGLLKVKYAGPMKAALAAAKLTVADSLDVKWLTF